jgi:hypothetical protein
MAHPYVEMNPFFCGSWLPTVPRSTFANSAFALHPNQVFLFFVFAVLVEDEMVTQDAEVPSDPKLPTPQMAG